MIAIAFMTVLLVAAYFSLHIFEYADIALLLGGLAIIVGLLGVLGGLSELIV